MPPSDDAPQYSGPRRNMHRISVSIRPPGMDIAERWSALVQRAPANVFMDPIALAAATATGFARIHTLLAWDHGAQPERLVGLWALQQMYITPLWPSFLAAPPFNYAFLSNPVIDPEFTGDVIAAFLDAIEEERSLPNVIRLRCLDASSEVYPAILHALAARGGQVMKMSERERPFVTKDAGLKRTGSTRKKLRQDWNRLSALGAVGIVNERAQDAVCGAFETYLAMESESWKGARGTALLCDESDAAFARRLISDLAAQRRASVAMLRIDNRPIAAQVLLYCGTTAYTWKTAFDAEFAKYSPGALLVDKITDQLFETEAIEAIESCSPEGGFMNQLWDGRRATVDLLADVGAKASLGFAAVVVGERGYAQLRGLRNKLRTVNWPLLSKRRGLAASR
jgi:CelD/BcsL family acetyltransferase involved in cellulose biosynthesis